MSAHGVIQPIILRKASIGYQLIAGERRLRACQMIGKKTIPAMIHDIADRVVAAKASAPGSGEGIKAQPQDRHYRAGGSPPAFSLCGDFREKHKNIYAALL